MNCRKRSSPPYSVIFSVCEEAGRADRGRSDDRAAEDGVAACRVGVGGSHGDADDRRQDHHRAEGVLEPGVRGRRAGVRVEGLEQAVDVVGVGPEREGLGPGVRGRVVDDREPDVDDPVLRVGGRVGRRAGLLLQLQVAVDRGRAVRVAHLRLEVGLEVEAGADLQQDGLVADDLDPHAGAAEDAGRLARQRGGWSLGLRLGRRVGGRGGPGGTGDGEGRGVGRLGDDRSDDGLAVAVVVAALAGLRGGEARRGVAGDGAVVADRGDGDVTATLGQRLVLVLAVVALPAGAGGDGDRRLDAAGGGRQVVEPGA